MAKLKEKHWTDWAINGLTLILCSLIMFGMNRAATSKDNINIDLEKKVDKVEYNADQVEIKQRIGLKADKSEVLLIKTETNEKINDVKKDLNTRLDRIEGKQDDILKILLEKK